MCSRTVYFPIQIDLISAGPLFGARTRRRIARVGFVLLQITCGFVLRARYEVYSRNLASFARISRPPQNCTALFVQPPFMCCAGTTYRNPSSYRPFWKCKYFGKSNTPYRIMAPLKIQNYIIDDCSRRNHYHATSQTWHWNWLPDSRDQSAP